jgi:hypothetical protein
VTEEEIGHLIIGAAIKVHSIVGPGLLDLTWTAGRDFAIENGRNAGG